ncbi:hypothetical protein [Croceicoccus sp. YJ47]|uniref:hypothetical protein n=1 Tax=Croceicoccus sp. YJ47 TaxID=2798724 RepID=UPI001923E819|nr:hypothetical protein [Croceicoccus sp. YJ47]QQN73168.1 hypothetical protein JD971_09835 [Croceicoccus sp. YJ47]
MSLPPEIDFAADRAATPARMNRAMGYLLARLRALEALQPDLAAVINELRTIGFERLTDALQPIFAQVLAVEAEVRALEDRLREEGAFDPLLVKDANLADLSDVAAARDNLGLGSAALAATSDFANADLSNVAADLRAHLGSVSLLSAPATSALDFAKAQVFRINVATDITITFANPPAADRALTAVVHLSGASLASRMISWPAAVTWSNGTAPLLEGTDMCIVLFWTGAKWLGTTGPKA